MASSVRYWPARVSARVRMILVSLGLARTARAQGVEPFLGPAELEAELGEELVMLGVARRGGQQVAAGLDGGVDPAQPGLELGDAGQVLGAVAAVDLGQPPQGVGGVAQVAGRLADAGGQRPGRDRTRLDLDRPVGRAAPPRGACRRPRGTGPARPIARRSAFLSPSSSLRSASIRCGEPAGRLVVLDARFEDGVFLLVLLGELARGGELGLGVVEPLEPVRDTRPASSAGRSRRCRARRPRSAGRSPP